MKTRWTFHFTSKGVQFPIGRSFRATATATDGTVIVLEIEINPAPGEIPPDSDGAGEFVLVVPGRPEENEQLAYHTVDRLAQQIGFPVGHVKVLGGFVTATRIPETPEEEREIGDARHLVKLAFEEMPRFMPSFDPAQVTRASADPGAMELLRQFNIAREVQPYVERFLAHFKVLEKAYGSGPEMDLSLALRRNGAFMQLVAEVVTVRSHATEESTAPSGINPFVQKLIQARNNCAHLRKKTGYSPSDPRIATEVRPLLKVVEALARECVFRHVYPDGGPEPQRGLL